MKVFLFCVLLLTNLTGCRQNGSYNSDLSDRLFRKGERAGTITEQNLTEVSGIVTSSVNPGMFWTHNDSGDEPNLYLISKEGDVKMTVTLNGIKNKDWEDIALVNSENGSFIYVGDIGDNLGRRKKLFIHKLEEPKYNDKATLEIDPEAIQTMTFRYENGARDAETLLVDHHSRELIIVTKRDEKCFIYSFPFRDSVGVIDLKPTGRGMLNGLTGGDANEAGEILIKSYEQVYYWSPSEVSVAERIINGPDYRIPYIVEPQGEAICWDGAGNFFTVSEFHQFSKQYIYFYERKRE